MKKYIWRIISALLAIAAIIAAYNIYFISRPVKALQIIIDTASQLVSIRPEATGSIQIVYNGKVVSNPQILQITIKNSGNQSIMANDYSTLLLFSFDQQDEIIDVSVINSQPSNIGMNVNKTSLYEATATPILLNPGDTVTVRFIVAESGNDSILSHFHIDGRIVGVKEVALVPQSDQQQGNLPYLFLYFVQGFVLLLGAVGVLLWYKLDKDIFKKLLSKLT